jgi:hypothetical protein
MGLGGWVEQANPNSKEPAPLEDWMPPTEWGVGVHSRHLRNLYIYFWRWATWKVFDHNPEHNKGIISFITVAGFLGGPGFQKMRDYLRRTCDDIWVIDCSPEGYQPDVPTRIFQGVKQTVCIVMVSRSKQTNLEIPANVRFRALPTGTREIKFEALKGTHLNGPDWIDCPTGWRARFLPESQGAWATFPELMDLFAYNGAGLMSGRVWITAPDEDSLRRRWKKLLSAPATDKERLFHPHLRKGELGDKHSQKIVPTPLHGFPICKKSVADEDDVDALTVRYGFRSFDRQFIIPDARLINQPNPELWNCRSDDQIYLTAFSEETPSGGPALTFTGLVPDVHHYKGSFGGRVFPLWRDDKGKQPNCPPSLLPHLSEKYEASATAEDLMAYIASVAAHPAYIAKFQDDLSTPGLRIPLTADSSLFAEAAELGRRVLWLHTFGERMTDPKHGRPAGPPRLPAASMPTVPKEGAISSEPDEMPDSINYDAWKQRLLVGHGFIENVPLAVWEYEVSGMQVLLRWFSYRQKNRERTIIGNRRLPSPLGDIQPDHWLPEYTTELLNVLNVLGLLVELEPMQADLLERICAGPLISEAELKAAGALEVPAVPKKPTNKKEKPLHLFGG